MVLQKALQQRTDRLIRIFSEITDCLQTDFLIYCLLGEKFQELLPEILTQKPDELHDRKYQPGIKRAQTAGGQVLPCHL